MRHNKFVAFVSSSNTSHGFCFPPPKKNLHFQTNPPPSLGSLPHHGPNKTPRHSGGVFWISEVAARIFYDVYDSPCVTGVLRKICKQKSLTPVGRFKKSGRLKISEMYRSCSSMLECEPKAPQKKGIHQDCRFW